MEIIKVSTYSNIQVARFSKTNKQCTRSTVWRITWFSGFDFGVDYEMTVGQPFKLTNKDIAEIKKQLKADGLYC